MADTRPAWWLTSAPPFPRNTRPAACSFQPCLQREQCPAGPCSPPFLAPPLVPASATLAVRGSLPLPSPPLGPGAQQFCASLTPYTGSSRLRVPLLAPALGPWLQRLPRRSHVSPADDLLRAGFSAGFSSSLRDRDGLAGGSSAAAGGGGFEDRDLEDDFSPFSAAGAAAAGSLSLEEGLLRAGEASARAFSFGAAAGSGGGAALAGAGSAPPPPSTFWGVRRAGA